MIKTQQGRQKQQRISKSGTQQKIRNLKPQYYSNNNKILTRYNMDKISSFNKFDIRGIIRLQFLDERQKELMNSYKINTQTRKYSTSRTKSNKFDMIIPSFQAFNINEDSLLGLNQDIIQKVTHKRPKTHSKNFRSVKKKNSVIEQFNLSTNIQHPQHIQTKIQNEQQQPKIIFFSKKSQQLSKQLYKQLHKKDFNQTQIKFRSKNVQNIIRRKGGSNFTEAIQEYCRRMKIQKNSRIFIFQSSDIWMKEALIQKGWVLNPDPASKIFHLKWTNKISSEKASKDQLINHFYDSDLLTSKEGLAKIVRKSNKLSKISPRSFDLGLELKKFIINFNQTQILCGLKKIIKEIIKNNLTPNEVILNQNLKISFQQLKKSQKYEQYNKQNEQVQKSFVLHIPYAIQLCAFCQNIRCEIEQQPKEQCHHLNQKSLKNLFNFSILKPPYNQYASSLSSSQQIKNFNIRFNLNNINMYSSESSFRKATDELIKILYSYHQYLCQNLNTYQDQGVQNIWITKNRNSSKGIGISLSSSLPQLLKKVENKLVQKYIEDCALYKTIDGQYKYDLRVWVLTTSFNPLITYFYQEFYCRLCSQPYDLENLNQSQSHLTNYSTNKQSFLNNPTKKSSILTYPQFLEILSRKLNISVEQSIRLINKRLKSLIYQTLLPYINLIRSYPECFQLYGFDLLVTQKMNMYLLQVNLSPACQVRSQWMAEKVKKMSHGVLGIVEQKLEPQKIRKLGWVLIDQQIA